MCFVLLLEIFIPCGLGFAGVLDDVNHFAEACRSEDGIIVPEEFGEFFKAGFGNDSAFLAGLLGGQDCLYGTGNVAEGSVKA